MRLTVSRSSKNISAQIIDDKINKTLFQQPRILSLLKTKERKNLNYLRLLQKIS